MFQIKTPNLRRLLVPDPGMTWIDADLAGADAQVVAWEADDPDLKAAFRRGEKIHVKNSKDLFGCDSPKTTIWPNAPGRQTVYDICKKTVHGVNYLEGIDTLASFLGDRHQAALFRAKWFALHPAIPAWHQRIDADLHSTRTVRNVFGYHCPFLDRMDGLLPKAVAWIPQSTVAICCTRGALNVRKTLPEVQILNNGHDSLSMQAPTRHLDRLLPQIAEALAEGSFCPYDDPLTIPWEFKTSPLSWGDCKEVEV